MARGKRYTEEERQEVIDYVIAHDKKNGRGGKAAAAKKFGVNINSVLNWMSSAKKPKGRPAKKTVSATRGKPGRKKGSTVAVKAPAVSGDETQMLERMLDIQKQIDSLKAEYSAIRAKL